jgi:hypothetical protein
MPVDWKDWEFLLGDWDGGDKEHPEQGYGTFSFSLDLDSNILMRKNRTVFPDTPERHGYTHDDLLIIYTEITGRKRAIYFDNEGHVIHYEVRTSPGQKDIVLESDANPSAPQFRFTYIKTGENSLAARFEIALPGQAGEFTTYLEGTAKRRAAR